MDCIPSPRMFARREEEETLMGSPTRVRNILLAVQSPTDTESELSTYGLVVTHVDALFPSYVATVLKGIEQDLAKEPLTVLPSLAQPSLPAKDRAFLAWSRFNTLVPRPVFSVLYHARLLVTRLKCILVLPR